MYLRAKSGMAPEQLESAYRRRLINRAAWTAGGVLLMVDIILFVTYMPLMAIFCTATDPACQPSSEGAPPPARVKESILEMFERLRKSVQPEAWDNTATDGAKNHKHYLCGFPKEGGRCGRSSRTQVTG